MTTRGPAKGLQLPSTVGKLRAKLSWKARRRSIVARICYRSDLSRTLSGDSAPDPGDALPRLAKLLQISRQRLPFPGIYRPAPRLPGAGRLASDLTGAFFFTDPSNLELLAKVINLGDRVAVFYGALSDLDYTLTVTDTRSGQALTYHNPAGNLCGGLGCCRRLACRATWRRTCERFWTRRAASRGSSSFQGIAKQGSYPIRV